MASREWTIYACTVEGCGYWRDDMSTGVHVVDNPEDWRGKPIPHPLEAVVVVAKDEGRKA